MAEELGVFESKTRFSELVSRVARGETFVITKRGRRIAELRPIEQDTRPLSRGCAKHVIKKISKDFDAPLDDFKDYM